MQQNWTRGEGGSEEVLGDGSGAAPGPPPAPPPPTLRHRLLGWLDWSGPQQQQPRWSWRPWRQPPPPPPPQPALPPAPPPAARAGHSSTLPGRTPPQQSPERSKHNNQSGSGGRIKRRNCRAMFVSESSLLGVGVDEGSGGSGAVEAGAAGGAAVDSGWGGVGSAGGVQVKLQVVSGEGEVWSAELELELSLERLKALALAHLYQGQQEKPPHPAAYKLVHASQSRQLPDHSTLMQENVKDNDEILLLPRRHPPPTEMQTEREMAGPTQQEILEATAHLQPSQGQDDSGAAQSPAPDFQSEMRKILVSLVEASTCLLSPSPEAVTTFLQMRERMQTQSRGSGKGGSRGSPTSTGRSVALSGSIPNQRDSSPTPEPHLLRHLLDMGFTQRRARTALKMTNYDPGEALEWLLEHPGDEVEESPSPELPEKECPVDTAESSPLSALQSLRRACRREFHPDGRALQSLREMGFSESEATQALRATDNKREAACDWLLGDRRGQHDAAETDLKDEGLPPDSPVLAAILANPVVQLGLSSPKVLVAFVSMLEQPSSANIWLNDPDTSPVLSHIFKTYHAEKHSVAPSSSIPGSSPAPSPGPSPLHRPFPR